MGGAEVMVLVVEEGREGREGRGGKGSNGGSDPVGGSDMLLFGEAGRVASGRVANNY